jgi:hypothetical protein
MTVPPECTADYASSFTEKKRRHPSSGASFHATFCEGSKKNLSEISEEAPRTTIGLRLAGKCSRTRQCHRTRCRSKSVSRNCSPRSPSQNRCGPVGVPVRWHFLSRRHGRLPETVGDESAGPDSRKPRRRSQGAESSRKVFSPAVEIARNRCIDGFNPLQIFTTMERLEQFNLR